MSSEEEEKESTAVTPPAEEAANAENPSEPTTAEPVTEETKASVPAAEEAEEKEPEEEEIEVVEEKIYTIPIARLEYATDRGHRSPKAVRDVRTYIARHMKADEVAISNEINQAIWARGINKPPRKITVRAVKDKEGKVIVYPAKSS